MRVYELKEKLQQFNDNLEVMVDKHFLFQFNDKAFAVWSKLKSVESAPIYTLINGYNTSTGKPLKNFTTYHVNLKGELDYPRYKPNADKTWKYNNWNEDILSDLKSIDEVISYLQNCKLELENERQVAENFAKNKDK